MKLHISLKMADEIPLNFKTKVKVQLFSESKETT